MAINWGLLQARLIEAATIAVNATAARTAARARERAPVRKIFRGGRQTVRLKTVFEIRADRDLRARLGLAPDVLGQSRTIEHPASARRGGMRNTGMTTSQGHPVFEPEGPSRAERGLTTNRRNRRNTFKPGGRDLRAVNEMGLLKWGRAWDMLTARGKYELASGRAIVRDTDAAHSETGERIARGHLGGGLRKSIRVESAKADQYPVIEALVVAGDEAHPYAQYQELGTRHNPAHPFLRPALAEAREELPGEVRKALRRIRR